MNVLRTTLLCILILISACQPPANEPPLTGAFLGATTFPVEEPLLLGEGLVTTDLNERDGVFSPSGDAFFYTIMASSVGTIVYTVQKEEGWSIPEVAPFSGEYSDLEPFITPDGSRLYFASNRPLQPNGDPKDYDIWYVAQTDSVWSDPINIGEPVNTEGNEFYPSLTRSGSLVYTARREDAIGREDLYMARPDESGGFLAPLNLGPEINTPYDEFNSVIDPDEEFILYSSFGRPDGQGGGDLYIHFKDQQGNWGPAHNLGPAINSTALDYCPSISPDGEYVFFTSRRVVEREVPESFDALSSRLRHPGNGQGDIYWISFEFLKENYLKLHGDSVAIIGMSSD